MEILTLNKPARVKITDEERTQIVDHVRDNPCTSRQIFAMLQNVDEGKISQTQAMIFRNDILKPIVDAGILKSKPLGGPGNPAPIIYWANPHQMREKRVCADCGKDFTDVCPGGVKLDGTWYCLVHAQERGWIHPRDRI